MKAKFTTLMTLSLCALGLSACNNGGGGGGGGGSGTAQNTCVFTAPPADFGGLTTSDINSVIQNLSSARTAANGNVYLTYAPTFANYSALVWNGTTWTAQQIVPPSTFTITTGSTQIFDYNGALDFLISGFGGALNGQFLYQQGTSAFGSDIPVSGYSPLWDSPIVANSSTGFAGYPESGATGPNFYLQYYQNKTAGDFTIWQQQSIATSTTAGYAGFASGFFADDTPYVVAGQYTLASTNDKLSLFRRAGSTWSDVLDFYTLDVSTGKGLYNVEVHEMPGKQLLVLWTEYHPPSSDVERVIIVNLDSLSASTAADIFTNASVSFSNETYVHADVSSDGTVGAFAVHDPTKGQIWLGNIAFTASGATISAGEEYRPDLTFNNQSEFLLKYMACDQPVLFANPTSGGLVVDPLTANKYDGIPGD